MITIVGGGFAGVEAAWAAAQSGVSVRLFEMRPSQMTPAHQTPYFAELVCSNSLKSKLPTSPAGRLKAEMERLGSLILEVAALHEVPGGQALAVDRDAFAAEVTSRIESHPDIEVARQEFLPSDIDSALDQGPLVLASGPLTSPGLSDWLATATGRKHLHFYDAVSPTVDASTIDRTIAFAQSRYDKGGDDYLNCPFDKESYEAFVHALVTAERVPVHAFEAGGVRSGASDEEKEGAFIEKIKYFSGCMPIEAIAEKGARSLAFGNFKPVGLTDPRTGRRPYAALQLRPENKEKSLYSLVACQNRLRWSEQKRVFRMVPGLEQAEFLRYGVIHRNTYLDAPNVLTSTLELRSSPGIFVSGQLTGVEGYVESAAMGILGGMFAAAAAHNVELAPPPRVTALGSLLSHLQDETPRDFAPMNINWGLFPEPEANVREKSRKRELKLLRAEEAFSEWVSGLPTLF